MVKGPPCQRRRKHFSDAVEIRSRRKEKALDEGDWLLLNSNYTQIGNIQVRNALPVAVVGPLVRVTKKHMLVQWFFMKNRRPAIISFYTIS